MAYTTLISTAELAPYLNNPDWITVDCRFSLNEPEQGRRDYEEAHLSDAVYAHLDKDLAGPVIPGQTGRHPLPAVETLARTFANWGIGAEVQVVAYDDSGGSIAARLWWLLRWLGHPAVAVLDGGWPRWQSEGRPVSSKVPARSPRIFTPQLQPHLLASAAEVLARQTNPTGRLLDARSADRYRGENEPFDPVAGRIPGAISAPFADNLGPDGLFLPPEALHARFQALLGDAPPESAIFYCGSGVTAAHDLLAMAHAGLGDGQLYAGSWSEWITDPAHPIATG